MCCTYKLNSGFVLFRKILNQLEAEVTVIARKNQQRAKHHPKTKLLRAVLDNIVEDVPSNPDHPKFRQGNTLGKQNRDWRRVKHHLPPRYRLFFKFSSDEKRIVYAWLNDQSTLRKAGAKTDVYEVFKRMLRRGDVPNTWKELLNESESAGC